ncbi:uncharacterized protein LOC113272548 [Papaver somniferum]|uniref:uncharacterized protein LOC113272548 n=1 Tax=Papaver somniferum TaxID=3469 RepID=UPI000E6F5BCD|nr:uncharacterized protein LOC113272548 [Papaver somniferum]
MATCATCHNSDHLVDNCPDLHEFQESRVEQANALYHKQENNPYSHTYNPRWRNHPNFSWSKGPIQGGTTSNNQGYSYPRNPQVQSHTQYPVDKKPSFEDSVGLLTQNLLQLQKTTDQRFTSLELKMGQICDALNEREKGKLPSQPQHIQKSAFQASTSACDETSHNQVNVVTTLHSGKVVENNVGVPQSKESNSNLKMHTTPHKTSSVEKESEQDSDSKNSTDVNVPIPSSVPVAPFPQRLVQQKKGTQYHDMLEMFKRVNINIPFLEVIQQIPAYAKFLKDLCTQKRKLHVHKRAFFTEQVSSTIQNKTPPKFKDPGSPTISCTIGDHTIEKDLLDLGASVNLLPYSVYVQLGLGEMKPTPVTLQLAERYVKIPRGIVEDVLIKVDKFYFPVDFIVLDTQHVQNPDCHIPVILGRPFLETSNGIINCRSGILNFSFGNMTVELNMFHVNHLPMDFNNNELHKINMIESLIQDSLPDILFVDPLQACLDNFDLDLFDYEYISEVNSLLESVAPMDIAKWQIAVDPLPLPDSKSGPSLVEPPKHDLKSLHDTLKYAFLGSYDTLPVIIASCLDIE